MRGMQIKAELLTLPTEITKNEKPEKTSVG